VGKINEIKSNIAFGKTSMNLAIFMIISVLMLFAFYMFFSYHFYHAPGDFIVHIQLAMTAASDAHFYPSHFFYHLILNVFTFFSGNLFLLKCTAVFLLSLFCFLKIYFTLKIGEQLTGDSKINIIHVTILLVVPYFISPIINWWSPRIYLGQFTPNVWHNPTTIMLMPFSLACLLYLIKDVESDDAKISYSIVGSLFLVFSVITKPNFAMIFIPSLVVMYVFSRNFITINKVFIYVMPTIIIMLWQYLRTFSTDQKEGIIFDPMVVWLTYTPNPLGSLLVSFAFPLAFILFFYNKIRNIWLFKFSWLMLIVSLSQFLLLSESGTRKFHGNFFWGVFCCLYIVFIVSIIELILLYPGFKYYRTRYIVCAFILSLHFLSGIVFYIRSTSGLGPFV